MQTTPKYPTLVLASLLASTAFAAQPPDVVSSDGTYNTAAGTGALLKQPAGAAQNTAMGYNALAAGGSDDETAVGSFALTSATSGTGNSAFGAAALYLTTEGTLNTGIGVNALFENTTGSGNTGVGSGALGGGHTGTNNTAIGIDSLYYGQGSENSAVGDHALWANINGNSDTGLGEYALEANQTGNDNTAVGGAAMSHNVTGSNNVAVGNNALKNDSAGSGNIAVGYNAGDSLQKSNNIAIGNAGSSSDSGVVRIGTAGTQTAVYLAGVATTHVTGASVIVTSSGQLGVLASSERYKTAIAPIGTGTAKLEQLRPVSFHLKNDPRGAVQYGLIAEEVAKVYPELVIRNEAGRIEGVRYDELAPMLLNQVQQQARKIRELKAQYAEMRAALERKQAIGAAVAQR
jgi:hypothetical protein